MAPSSEKLRVLFVTPEVSPFSKTGGLADVSSALPRALRSIGCDIRILTPLYGPIDRSLVLEEPLVRDKDAAVSIGRRKVSFRQLSTSGSHDAVPVYFLEYDPLYDRPGIYIDPFSGKDYMDNGSRFLLLSHAAFELCRLLDWRPHIFHCNDWQTGIIPFSLRYGADAALYEGSRSLLTIHNMAYHGLFGSEIMSQIDGSDSFYYPGGPLEFYGRISFLKTGAEFADMLNTVSPTYAEEIQSSYEFGYGLEAVLRSRSDRLKGILNGIDFNLWNPAEDSHIPAPYTFDSISRKEINKQELCKRCGLRFEKNTPLIGMISRLTVQKGFEILIPVLADLLNLPVQFVMLGSGDPYLEGLLYQYASSCPGRFAATVGYDEDLAHLIEAGADLFLMPSKYEPCGLNQMMSMRYGTLPVVRATGGLADTVIDCDKDMEHGTGFSFLEYSPHELLKTVKRAAAVYRDLPRWRRLQENAMSMDLSWKHSAELYLDLYRACLDSKPRRLT